MNQLLLSEHEIFETPGLRAVFDSISKAGGEARMVGGCVRNALLGEAVHDIDIATNLTLIHDAIAEINVALERDPENILLQERLLNTYREELALLRRVSSLTRNVMLRNDI